MRSLLWNWFYRTHQSFSYLAKENLRNMKYGKSKTINLRYKVSGIIEIKKLKKELQEVDELIMRLQVKAAHLRLHKLIFSPDKSKKKKLK